MTATTTLLCRTGNNWYQIAHLIAYATKHGMDYYIPKEAPDCEGGHHHFEINSTGSNHNEWVEYREPEPASYHEISKKNNIKFIGFWQSFKYLDEYRAEILKAFNFSSVSILNTVSLHVRRGDYVGNSLFKVLPFSYYEEAVHYFVSQKINQFIVFSDDVEWCKKAFTNTHFPGCVFEFSEGKTEVQDIELMSRCEHNICANSSFSFAAAWTNQNPNKVVLCPDENYCWFNKDYIPEYFKVVAIPPPALAGD